MKSDSDLTIHVGVDDQATPVLDSLARRLWWMRHGEGILLGLVMLIMFLIGDIAGHLR